MKRVVVIGAGNRVMGAVLPALWCLRDRFAIEAVCARSVRDLAIAGGAATFTTRDTLTGIDYANVDLIVVAASLPQIPRILGALAREPVDRAVLMLDTPVMRLPGLSAGRAFHRFARVVVAEDTIALPPFLLARKLIDAGAIGALQRILLFHCGYKYHGLASIKMLAGGGIRRMTSRRFAKVKALELELDGGVHATMYEPRDYAIGKFLLEGERGAIADYAHAGDGVRRIGYVTDGPIYRGLLLDGEPVPPSGLDDAYLAGIGREVADASPMNTMKLRGLMDLLVAATDAASPLHYPPDRALVDDWSYRIASRVGVFAGTRALERGVRLAWGG